jgi:hypothetical protein
MNKIQINTKEQTNNQPSKKSFLAKFYQVFNATMQGK